MSQTHKELSLFLGFLVVSFLFHFSSTVTLTTGYDFLDNAGYWIAVVIEAVFKPIEVFFHEASHALAAIMTGNHFYQIVLAWNGTGHAVLGEASTLKMTFSTFAGYAGAAVWGYLMFESSLREKRITRLCLVFFCLVFMHKAGNDRTVFVLLGIVMVFFFTWLFDRPGRYILRFIGVFTMVSAIYSPAVLIKYTTVGDHVLMEQYTGIPAFFWIAAWIVIASLFLYLAYKHIVASTKSGPVVLPHVIA